MAEDWAADVKKYAPNADDATIAGIVRYCGIALRKRDSSLVAFSDSKETDRVRENFLKKKLGLTKSDAILDKAIAAVGQRMKADRTKNRVTVYYLLAENFKMLQLFVKAPSAKAPAKGKAATPAAKPAKAPKAAAAAGAAAVALAGSAKPAATTKKAAPAAKKAAAPAAKKAAAPAAKKPATAKRAPAAKPAKSAKAAPVASLANLRGAEKAAESSSVASGAVAAAGAVGAAALGAAGAVASGAVSGAKAVGETAVDAAGAAGAAAVGAAGSAAAALGAAGSGAAQALTGGLAGDSEESGSGWNWLLWLLLAALALFLLWWLFLRQPADNDGAAGAATEAAAVSTDAAANAVAIASAPAEGSVTIPTGAGVTSELRDGKPVVKVYFDTGKTALAPAFSDASAGLKDYLTANPGSSLAVSGFNDPTGNAAANAALSKSRAEAVAAELVASGIAQESVALVKPDQATDTTVSVEAARRVEVVVK